MERFDITPDEAEQILNGRAFERDDLFEIRDFVRTAAAMNRTRPGKRAEHRHLLAIVEATAIESVPETAPQPRSTTMVRSVLRSKPFKALAGALVALVGMGGLAAAQTLPAPAQDAMAAVADRVGITLPHSEAFTAKHGADHDGDGVPDDNGRHGGQTVVKDGADHDGDGVADDNGNHTGQNQTKRGKDHDGDGVADDNGLHKGDDKASDDQTEVDDDDQGTDNDDQGDDENDDHHGNAVGEQNRGRGHGRDDAHHDEDDQPQTSQGGEHSNDD